MPDDWGGIERYVSYLSQALSDRGHAVAATCAPGSPLAARVGVRVLPLTLRTKYDPLALAGYLRLFRQEKFDVVNVHFSPDYFVPAFAAKLCGQPNCVLTRHLAIGWRKTRVRQFKRLYSHVIAVSQAVRRVLVDESGFDLAFVTAAQAGMPELKPTRPRDENRKTFGMSDGALHVGVFGRLTVEKGHAELLALWPSVAGAQLHVFGDGPERKRLEAMAYGTGVVLHGNVSDVSDAMDAVDVVATPSLWAEAFSLATLEAFSMGKPVVASPRGALPELVTDGVNGFLADPVSQPDLFAQRLSELAVDSGLRSRLGNAGRDLYASNFTLDKFGERIEAVYERLV